MWDCKKCGVLQIAGSLEECPVCHAPRPTEDVAEEPTSASAPEAAQDAQPSGTFPTDSEQEPPPHDDEEKEPEAEEESEEDGTDHDE